MRRTHMRVVARSSGVRSDQRRLRVLLLDVLADRGDLGEEGTVVEFEARELSARVLREIRLAAVLAADQVDGDERDGNALLCQEHAHDARVGSDAVVEFHGSGFLSCFSGDTSAD